MEINDSLAKLIYKIMSSISTKIKQTKTLLNKIEDVNLSDEQLEELIKAYNKLVDVEYLIDDFQDKINGESDE